jgi:hypothetical protein
MRTLSRVPFFLLLSVLQVSDVIAWENEFTHTAITKEAVEESVLAGNYLQTQLGLQEGLDTELELLDWFQYSLDQRVLQETKFHWNETEISIRAWLIDGSMLEDVPVPRARHHFHDAIRNTGLDNSDRSALIRAELKKGSKKKYPDYWPFDATGALLKDITGDRLDGIEPQTIGRVLSVFADGPEC